MSGSSIDETFGAAYIGINVAGFLLGVSAIQGWYYFTHQRDGWALQGLVAAVLVFDFIHQALITHTGYVYLVSFHDQPGKLGTVVWSLLAEVLFNGLAGFCVQCFLTYRIWKLSGTRVWLTSTVLSFVFAELACVLAFAIIAFIRVETFQQLAADLKTLSVTVNALAAAGDILIAAILTLLLQGSKTGFRRSDTMINKLTIFAVNTGALTSLCAVASLISILAAPDTFIYISFFFCMGRLYTNSLLATLNARKMIRQSADGINTSTSGGGGNNLSLPYTDYSARHTSKLIFQHSKNIGTNISIQVDTTREFISDLVDCDTEPGRCSSIGAVVTRETHCMTALTSKRDEVELDFVQGRDESEGNSSSSSQGDIESVSSPH